MSNSNFTNQGRLNATISAILETRTGTNETTGEVYTYLVVEATAQGCAKPIKENIFVNKFNELARIAVGASIDIVYSKNVTTGKISSTVFLGNKYAGIADKMSAAGCSEEAITVAKTSAMDAVKARQAARANAAK